MWGNVEGTGRYANALKGQRISAPHAAQRNVGLWGMVVVREF
ncbi:hypothetical protein Barb4_02783 [Bacteroidales bacterium Barb4]|nr:hypothetical protein Barb4_02783 [Bacteroidales bacterium Barb4]